MNKNIRVAPSIFAADFYTLSGAVELFETADTDMIHFDVMDNHFVPNISFGMKFIEDIMARTNIPADIHLMIDINQKDTLAPFLKLPAENITLHLESVSGSLLPDIELIKNAGKKAGISIKPGTPVDAVLPYLADIDLILLMSVEPGYSGQKFLPESIGRLKEMKTAIGQRKISLQIDGGIERENYAQVIKAGGDILVIGSAFFKDKNIKGWVKDIHTY